MTLKALETLSHDIRRIGLRRAPRRLGLGAVLLWAIACDSGADMTRKAPPPATLGDDIYALMCDRVGAAAIAEDVTGASYHGICHYDAEGKYQSAVDTSVLPPATAPAAAKARALSIAKLETLAKHRSRLIVALNAALPDVAIDDVTTDVAGDTIRLHDALWSLGQTITPLYEDNPFNESGEPLIPRSTRSLGRLFDALASSPEAKDALARLGGRQGYRPSYVGLGAVRPALAYPGLRDFTKASLRVLGPDGAAAPELQQVLTVVEHELRTSKPTVEPLTPYAVSLATAQPNRPRSAVEVAAAILLSEDASFAAPIAEPSRFIAVRDRRGFVLPLGNAPSEPGTVPPPFADMDGDGLADVDAFGSFLDTSGAAIDVPTPFILAGAGLSTPADPYGRAAPAIYQYIDTSKSLTRAIATDLKPLLDPTRYAAEGDPAAWSQEHETLMYALAGAYALFGDRADAQYDGVTETIRAPSDSCEGCVKYSRFIGEKSPLADLVHAAGQIFADSESDAMILSLTDLLENHEDTVARLVGAILRVKEIADQHDALAAAGVEPRAELAYEVPIWDEMALVVSRMSAKPGLIAELLRALADDSQVVQHGPSRHVGDTVATFMEMRDALSYDRWGSRAPNGPAINLTDGYPSTADMHNPVDRGQPLTGDNRSCLQRSLQIIHDSNGVKACNKEGATVKAKLAGIGITWPIWPAAPYTECELFQLNNLAAVYLDALLDPSHPKRMELKLEKTALTGIMNALGAFGADPGTMFEQSSGIDGLTLHPTPAAVNRLVFFGADSDQFGKLPDYDAANANSQTAKFLNALIEPVGTVVCPKNANGVPHCADSSDLYRVRDPNTLFLWERLGFNDYLKPIVTAFADTACDATRSQCNTDDMSGEQLFIDVVEVLHRHWAGKEHGAECSPSGSAATNPKYCSEAGANSYEPIAAEALRGDLMVALHEFAKVVTASKVTIARGPRAGQTLGGAEVMEQLTRILFDQDYARSVNMRDRAGLAQATWVDGTPQAQLTPFTLFADALHGFDERFTKAPDGQDRQAQWRRARSQLVDQFLAVDGEGPDAHFRNRALPKLLTLTMGALRQQLNANCPAREAGGGCTWASHDLGQKFATTLSGPVFATVVDLMEKLRQDEPARRETERFVSYLLDPAAGGDTMQSTLASLSDILQVLTSDATMAPIFNAVATAASPAAEPTGPGVADTTIALLQALTDDQYDRYHVLDAILPALVTPLDNGTGPTPIEVILDAIADVNRQDAASSEAFAPADYGLIMKTVDEFFTSQTRGLEQIYYIVQHRRSE